MQTLTIKGQLPSLNQLIGASNASHFVGANLKRKTDELIGWTIKAARLKPVVGKVWFSITYYEKDKRRDFDNIASGKKYLLDALQKQGILQGDGWKHLAAPAPFEEFFFIDRDNPRIEICIYDEEVDIGKEPE